MKCSTSCCSSSSSSSCFCCHIFDFRHLILLVPLCLLSFSSSSSAHQTFTTKSSLASTSTISATTTAEYLKAVRIAQCRARCLAQVDENFPKLDQESQFLITPSSCSHPKCGNCLRCIRAKHPDGCGTQFGLPLFCTTTTTSTTTATANSNNNNRQRHHSSTSLSTNQTLSSYHPTFSAFSSPMPTFHCSEKLHAKNNHSITSATAAARGILFNAAFRFEYSTNHSGIIENFGSWEPDLIPRIFVIKKDINGSVEYSITERWLNVFLVPENTPLTLTVTAVSASTIYAPTLSKPIQFKDSIARGRSPPIKLKVAAVRKASNSKNSNQPSDSLSKHLKSHSEDDFDDYADYNFADYPKDESKNKVELEILLHYASGSGEDATCHYAIYYLQDAFEKKETKTPEEAFWFIVDKRITRGTAITFGKAFTVKIFELHELGSEENSSFLEIKTPTCLEFLNGNFSVCAPPTVTNLKGELTSDNRLILDWTPPMYTNPSTNKIDLYEIRGHRVVPLVLNGAHLPAASTMQNFFREKIPGHLTHFEYQLNSSSSPAADSSGAIKITIQAFTAGGSSKLASTTIHPPLEGFVPQGNIKVKLWASIGTILTLIFLISGSFGIKHLVEKRKRKKSNQSYFETLSLKGDENGPPYQSQDSSTVSRAIPNNYSSKWEIDINLLVYGDVIGKGAFGYVRKAQLFTNGGETTEVAVKTLNSGEGIESSKFWEEFEILKSLGPHEHVLRLIGIVANYGPPALVVEYCHGGDLQIHLRNFCRYQPPITSSMESIHVIDDEERKDAQESCFVVTNEVYFTKHDDEIKPSIYYLTDLDLLSYARQVACGMEFLATNKIVHRDLAARNVLVSYSNIQDEIPTRTLKIADFGLSRDVYEQNWYKKNSNGLIPFKWLAIESLLQEVYTSKSDVWSFGVLLWEIFTFGGSPFPGFDNNSIFELLKNGYRMPKPDNCSEALYSLMRSCWNERPADRPDFSTVKAKLDKMMEVSGGLDYLHLDSLTADADEEVVYLDQIEREDEKDIKTVDTIDNITYTNNVSSASAIT